VEGAVHPSDPGPDHAAANTRVLSALPYVEFHRPDCGTLVVPHKNRDSGVLARGRLCRTGSCRLGRGGDGRPQSERSRHGRRVDATGCAAIDARASGLSFLATLRAGLRMALTSVTLLPW